MIDLTGIIKRTITVTERLDSTSKEVADRVNQGNLTVYDGFGYGVEAGIHHFLKQMALEGYSVCETVKIKRPVMELEGSEHLHSDAQERLLDIAGRIGDDELRSVVKEFAAEHVMTEEVALYTLLQDDNWLMPPKPLHLKLEAGKPASFSDFSYTSIEATSVSIGDTVVDIKLTLTQVPEGVTMRSVYVLTSDSGIVGFITIHKNNGSITFTQAAHKQLLSSEAGVVSVDLIITIN